MTTIPADLPTILILVCIVYANNNTKYLIKIKVLIYNTLENLIPHRDYDRTNMLYQNDTYYINMI